MAEHGSDPIYYEQQREEDLHFELNLDNSGRLRSETVTAETRQAMLHDILNPNLRPGLYVEVGFGNVSYAQQTNREFGDNARYLGIEGGKSEYYASRRPATGWMRYGTRNAPVFMQNVKLMLQNQEYAQLIWGDAQKMPLPTAGSGDTATQPPKAAGASDDQPHSKPQGLPVREVFMSDVIVTPGVRPDSAEKIFKEQARILDPDGYLVIRETDMDITFHRSQPELFDALDKAGFGKRAIIQNNVTAPPEVLRKLWRQYPSDFESEQLKATYIVCQKGQGDAPLGKPDTI